MLRATWRLTLDTSFVGVVILFYSAVLLWGVANGSVSGTVTDLSGAVIPGAHITLVNTALNSTFRAACDIQGFYSFPSIPVGHYDLIIEVLGFKTKKKKNLKVDNDDELKIDAVME